jgi:hypothetical protein
VIGDIPLPPAQFDVLYTGHLIKRELSAEGVDKLCHSFGLDPRRLVLACSIPMPGACLVVIPWFGIGGVGARTRAVLLRHELGHCNGWRHADD